MRILILSCNTGEGHNSAAKAIAQVLSTRGVPCEITDALSFWSPKISRLICNWHVRLYKRAPVVFNAGYRMAEEHDPEPSEVSTVYRLMSRGAKKLHDSLVAGHYDAVVCTHVFASLIMRRVRENYPQTPPHYFVATDYTCSPYVAESQATMYMIPDEKLTEEFCRCGIPKERILPTGIPVRQVFFQQDKAGSRENLDIPMDKKVVLLMCGSMGCGPMKRLAQNLAEQLPPEGLLIAICGHNEKLYRDLRELGDRPNLRVLGFTTEMPVFMDAADLMLTKPGGLSSTEAAAKRLPMIFVDAVGGCEGRNLEFYLRHSLAQTAESVEDLTRQVCETISDPARLASMAKTLVDHFPHNGAVEICDYLAEQLEASM